MEYVDIYDERHEPKNHTKERHDLEDGEYRLSVFTWIINSNNEILIQQRTKTTKKFPNIWGASSAGGNSEGETIIDTAIRETKEEIDVDIKKEELIYIGNYKRKNDFVEVFLVNKDIDINALKINPKEVQAIKWVTINEFENMLYNKEAIRSGYDIFKMYIEGGFNE